MSSSRPDLFGSSWLMMQEYVYQATLFYNSMSEPEKQNMISAAQFELSKCEEHIVHQNAISRFNEIDHDFALAVAEVFPAVKVPEGKPNHGQRSDFLSQVNGKNQGMSHIIL
jgi:catalase